MKFIKDLINKYNSCKYRWHKWIPVFIKGTYNNKEIKFITCKCDRCYKWSKEISIINNLAINRKYWTYNEEYFDN